MRALPIRYRVSLMLVGFALVTAFVAHVSLNSRTRSDHSAPPVAQPLEGRGTLVQELSRESVFDSIDRLPNFNDTVWVLGTISPGGYLFGYARDRVFVPRLNRVRKILDEAQGHRQEVIDRLEGALVESCVDYDRIYNEFRTRLDAAGGGIALVEPDENERRCTNAPACTYLLAELDSFDSLRMMSRVYRMPGRLAVNRLFVLYSMHILAVNHPREGLSTGAKKAVEEYLAYARAPRRFKVYTWMPVKPEDEYVTAMTLPTVERTAVPAWNARFEESDFRHDLFKEDLGLGKDRQVHLRFYPPLPHLEVAGEPRPEVDDIFKQLQKFVELAYP